MNFFDQIKQIATRVKEYQPNAQNEAQTISYLIYPFLKDVLGYDYASPKDVVREFDADIAGKKGEKVDIALLGEDGNPIILIEVKSCADALGADPLTQLKRYFPHTPARVCILTNGLIYKFFSEKSDNNKVNLDSEPFLEVNLLKYAQNTAVEDDSIKKLQKFRKKDFDVEEILCAAEDLKYTNAMKEFFKRQLSTPDDEFVKVVLKGLPFDTVKRNRGEKFGPHVKQALNEIIGERVAKRIAAAGDLEKIQLAETSESLKDEHITKTAEDSSISEALDGDGITISEEVLEAIYITKAILAEIVDMSRISYKTTSVYISIIIDGKVSKWICRFMISKRSNSINVINMPAELSTEKIRLDSVNDIYKHRELLLQAAKRHL